MSPDSVRARVCVPPQAILNILNLFVPLTASDIEEVERKYVLHKSCIPPETLYLHTSFTTRALFTGNSSGK